MVLTYFKRFRMEADLLGPPLVPPLPVPAGFQLVPWESTTLAAHAEAKFQSFRAEIDANVFPCLADYDGCLRLMNEISRKEGFLPEATWLVTSQGAHGQIEYCGTIQGIRDRSGMGAVQNLGIKPEYRGQRLGTLLMQKAMDGFRAAGLDRVFLEVTSQNEGAIRLYRRLGFYKVRTVYKAVDIVSCDQR